MTTSNSAKWTLIRPRNWSSKTIPNLRLAKFYNQNYVRIQVCRPLSPQKASSKDGNVCTRVCQRGSLQTVSNWNLQPRTDRQNTRFPSILDHMATLNHSHPGSSDMHWLANVKASAAFVVRCSFFSLSFILIHLLKPCRTADEWVDESLQIAFIRPLKMWRAEVAAGGTPYCTVCGRLFCRNLGFFWLCVVVPVPSWERSPASQFWLGHGEHARHVLSWNVADLQNWVSDPSRKMGRGTWWRWDDHGLWCSQQFCQIGPDQRLSP